MFDLDFNAGPTITFVSIGEDTYDMYKKVVNMIGTNWPCSSISNIKYKSTITKSSYPNIQRAAIEITLDKLVELKENNKEFQGFLEDINAIIPESNMVYIFANEVFDLDLIAAVKQKGKVAILITKNNDKEKITKALEVADSIIKYEDDIEKLIGALIRLPYSPSYIPLDYVDISYFFKCSGLYYFKAFNLPSDKSFTSEIFNSNDINQIRNTSNLLFGIASNFDNISMTQIESFINVIRRENKNIILYCHDVIETNDIYLLTIIKE